jgi:pimeloyl-ACP methyl ester carboxylesterase
MPVVYCICAILLLLAAPASAQQTPQPGAKTGYQVFLRGTAVGREDVSVTTNTTGTTIVSEGRLAPPINSTIRRAEIKYAADGTPQSFTLDASANGTDVSLRTTFGNGSAITQGSEGANPVTATQPFSPQALVLPNGVFGAFAAVSRRMLQAAPGMDLRAFLPPSGEVALHVDNISIDRMQTGTTLFDIRRYDLTLVSPGSSLAIAVTSTSDGSLLRVTIPAQSLDVIREDIASSTSRTQVFSNPGDEAVVIPAPGFNLAATITHPRAQGAARTPAVVLVGGAATGDRDGVIFGVPMLAQIAGAIADAGFTAVRYDKRGYGQSGGRAESATLSDYADDVRVVVKWLANRKDVDPKRIAVVGHSEGAMIAFIAASRDKGIAAVASLDGPAHTGADLLLEQQQHVLDLTQITGQERENKIALQKRILEAVATGKGWESVPPDLKREADTPWLQSLIAYDPAKVVDGVRQPILILHGELDKQVPVAHANQLADLARKESKSKSVDVVVVHGVNHLLVPAVTGEPTEYGTLRDRNVSKDVTQAITGWLTRTFAAVK